MYPSMDLSCLRFSQDSQQISSIDVSMSAFLLSKVIATTIFTRLTHVERRAMYSIPSEITQYKDLSVQLRKIVPVFNGTTHWVNGNIIQ